MGKNSWGKLPTAIVTVATLGLGFAGLFFAAEGVRADRQDRLDVIKNRCLDALDVSEQQAWGAYETVEQQGFNPADDLVWIDAEDIFTHCLLTEILPEQSAIAQMVLVDAYTAQGSTLELRTERDSDGNAAVTVQLPQWRDAIGQADDYVHGIPEVSIFPWVQAIPQTADEMP